MNNTNNTNDQLISICKIVDFVKNKIMLMEDHHRDQRKQFHCELFLSEIPDYINLKMELKDFMDHFLLPILHSTTSFGTYDWTILNKTYHPPNSTVVAINWHDPCTVNKYYTVYDFVKYNDKNPCSFCKKPIEKFKYYLHYSCISSACKNGFYANPCKFHQRNLRI